MVQKRFSKCVIDAAALHVRYRQRNSQAICQEAVMWKHMTHPNILPFLGVTTTPFQLVSVWMSGGKLSEYIEKHPDVDRVGLVRVHPVVSIPFLLPSTAIRRR